MDIFGHIKVGGRIKQSHRQLFEGKTLVIWYGTRPIIGTMVDGKWYQVDICGHKERLLFPRQIEYVSFLPSPYEGEDTRHR